MKHETWPDGTKKLPQKTAKATGYDPIEVEQPLPYGLSKAAVLAATKHALTGEIPAHDSPHQVIWLKSGGTVWIDEVQEIKAPAPKPPQATYEWGSTLWEDVQKVYAAQHGAILAMLKIAKSSTEQLAASLQPVSKAAGQLHSYIIDHYASGGPVEKPAPADTGASNYELVARLAELIPGMDEEAKCPVRGGMSIVREIVIYLNDRAKWTRERIADWLDTLSIDLTVHELEQQEKHARRIMTITDHDSVIEKLKQELMAEKVAHTYAMGSAYHSSNHFTQGTITGT